MMMKRSLFLAFSMIALLGCKRGAPESSASGAEASASWQAFTDFYERFHQDSAYQMAHITFPLEGLPQGADSVTIASGTFRWTPENWAIQHGFNLQSSDYEHQLRPVGDDAVIEKFVHRTGDLAIVRRFARLGDEWYLIYYAGLNNVRKDGGIDIEGGF
ncbi:MAG: hypothetical protein KDC66_02690 [Phaeodactylibacter sp.]|nr:hypothetical protein [Phaeodactylibacter sp.]MCB9277100.1 hypothetical protein [Lewinellaceae bacterium]